MSRKEPTRSSLHKPTPTRFVLAKTDSKPRLVKMYRKPLQENFVTNIPNPTPDTGISVGYNPGHTFSIISVTPTAPKKSSTFSPLPSLLAQPPSITATLVTSQTSFPPEASTVNSPSPMTHAVDNASPKDSSPNHTQGPKFPVVAIALLAVGSALVLIGVFIAIKACLRPTRRVRPKPSLPILDDGYRDRNFEVKEKDSPLFGGKERFSSQTGGLWAWANQPPSQSFVEPMQPAAHTKNTHPDDTIPQYNFPSSQSTWQPIPSYDSQSHLLSSHPVSSQSVPVLPVSHQPPRNQNALARTVSRFSVASLSLYPTSPISAQDIGVAISSKAFTADGHPILKKAALRRSKSEDDKMELAYDGASVTSPKIVQSPVVPATSGRTRIKSSYYTPGSYPRISTIPSSTSSKIRADAPYDVYPFPPMPKSDSRREHDKSLTSALELTSPSLDKHRIPPSPQPTLYPDDSMSVVAAKRASKRITARKSKSTDESGHVLPAASLDTGTALGSLMLNMDFGATNRSLATLAGKLGENISTYGEPLGSSATLAVNQSKGKALDRPPRVPSPPPLPSLTQMGLEHSDPVGFADYRSPTYSICGLYEDERKSRTSYYP
ncbi:hypothetical protein CPB85DRAFT_1269791 [Mucidula mucida]|nr:hypothetical protein CPB85DRAFT_1269791 [Mucidula mucida]